VLLLVWVLVVVEDDESLAVGAGGAASDAAAEVASGAPLSVVVVVVVVVSDDVVTDVSAALWQAPRPKARLAAATPAKIVRCIMGSSSRFSSLTAPAARWFRDAARILRLHF
jgi:hypothetical protein